VDEACEQWVAGKRGIRGVTRRGYEFAFDTWCAVALPPSQAVTKEHLDPVGSTLANRLRRGKPKCTSHAIHLRCRRLIFETARRQDLVARHVAELAQIPRARTHRTSMWRRDEARRLRRTCAWSAGGTLADTPAVRSGS
jgi:hypothetical protein